MKSIVNSMYTHLNALDDICRYCSHGCKTDDSEDHDVWCKSKAKGITVYSEGDRPKVNRNRGAEVD